VNPLPGTKRQRIDNVTTESDVGAWLARSLKWPAIIAGATIVADLLFFSKSPHEPNALVTFGLAAFGAANATRTHGFLSGMIAGLVRALGYLACVLVWQVVWQRWGGPAWPVDFSRHLRTLVGLTLATAAVSAGVSAKALKSDSTDATPETVRPYV
jgi:hypothetical protein